MKDRRKWNRLLLPMLLVALLQGCGGGGSSDSLEQEVAELTSAIKTAVSDVSADFNAVVLELKELPATFSPSLGGTSASVKELLLELKSRLGTFTYAVETYRIVYTVAGQQEPLSGLVVVPVLLPGQKLSFPMVSLQHPTQVLREQSPSLVSKYGDEQLTVPFGMMLAAKGYIVAIPDYPGLGSNREVHPYGLLAIGRSVAGLIAEAGRADQPWSSGIAWNGDLFLMGFSEGGYASLAAAREIELNQPQYNLVGVAALDGPYDLSGTMRSLMLTADQNFAAPYFLPYAVAAFDSAYGALEPELRFDRAVVATPAADPLNLKLYPMLFGASSSEEIDRAMRTVVPYEGPHSILSDTYKNLLQTDGSFLRQKLQENDAFHNWTPRTRILLYHNPADDLVPIGNFDRAQSVWTGLGNVAFEQFTDAIPNLGSVHAGSLIPAYVRGVNWIDALAK